MVVRERDKPCLTSCDRVLRQHRAVNASRRAFTRGEKPGGSSSATSKPR
jgi:hypothetical protein